MSTRRMLRGCAIRNDYGNQRPMSQNVIDKNHSRSPTTVHRNKAFPKNSARPDSAKLRFRSRSHECPRKQSFSDRKPTYSKHLRKVPILSVKSEIPPNSSPIRERIAPKKRLLRMSRKERRSSPSELHLFYNIKLSFFFVK